MPKKKYTEHYYSQASFLGACEKTDPPAIDPPIEELKTLEVEWTTRMDFEKEIISTDNTQHYKTKM